MSVANRFRKTITKALSLSDIDDDKDDSPPETRDSIFAKSVHLFTSKITQNSHTTPTRTPNAHGDRKQKTLLIIDRKENNWSKIFKGTSLNGIYDVRIEQASLNDVEVRSSSEKGASVSMKVVRNGALIARSFRPDFVLFRQYVKGPDARTDYTNILLGLLHGLVPSVNSVFSTYCFLQKPLVYAELLKIRQRLGKENFPLIDQNYYQSYHEMLLPPQLPVVVKVGSANSGLGKVCVASPRGFQDVASLVSFTNSYAVSESFLDGKFDLRIYKFGQRYKVYKRKSLCDAWKTNTGASTVEEIALTERYKNWADECSSVFGGLDIICVEVIHTKDDEEYIIEVNNIPPSICPDKKEDDMRCIANIVLKRMEKEYPVPLLDEKKPSGNTIQDAIQLLSGPPSPMNGVRSEKLLPNQKQDEKNRPESAPPPEMNADVSKKHSASEKEIDSVSGRHSSLSGKFFSAFE